MSAVRKVEDHSQSRDNQILPVVLHTRVVSGQGGGPEKTILNSPRFLESLGYRALCAYMHPPEDAGFASIVERAAEANAPLLSIPDRGLRDWSIFRRMLNICREQNVAIWHGHDYKSNFLGLVLRRYWPMKLVTTVHGWVKFTVRTPLYYWIDKRCLRKFDRVLCVSDDLYESCLGNGVPEHRCRLVYNGIDTNQYQRSLPIADAKVRLGIPPHRMVVGAVGRLSQEKGFDLLIQAVANLIDTGIDLQLIIAGEGDARAQLEGLISSQSDPSRFRLLGHRSDTIELFQAMDIFTLSSLREGLPNVILEAMAMETPVVATRIAGVPRLVQHEHNGLLIEPGRTNELTAALSMLIDNTNLRRSYATAGRDTVETNFGFEKRMRYVAGIYAGLTDQAVIADR